MSASSSIIKAERGIKNYDLKVIFRISSTKRNEMAAKIAAAGMVSTQAQTMRPATRHFTADSRVVDPTPAIAPVMVWVVETGMPKKVAPNRVAAPAVSAQKPPTGLSLVIFDPIVWTIRQPPER